MPTAMTSQLESLCLIVFVALGTSAYSSLLLTWSLKVNPSAGLSSLEKQPSIFFASVSVSVPAALPFRNNDSLFERNSDVMVFLDSVYLHILQIFLCAANAGLIHFNISALERDPRFKLFTYIFFEKQALDFIYVCWNS